MSPDEYEEIHEATCVAETAKAIRVDLGDRQLWVPKSQLGEENEVDGVGVVGTLVVRRWFAEKEGISG